VPGENVVLAIHGVANRSEETFARSVSEFAAGIGRPEPGQVRPVYWGDLASQASTLQSVPVADDTNDLPSAAGAQRSATTPTPAPEAEAEAVAQATIARVSAITSQPVPADAEATVRRALEEVRVSAPSALTTEVADVLAQVVVAWPPSGTSETQRGLGDSLGDALKGVTEAFNDKLGDAVSENLQKLLRGGESAMSEMAARTLGDVLQYGSSGARIRGRLDAAYGAARAGGAEVDLVAHSLGGMVVAEWLLGAPVERDDGTPGTPPGERRVRRLLTFGTQISLMAELHGLRTAEGSTPPTPPLLFTGAVERWVNVWHQIDPLAFVMGRVLQLPGPNGPVPVEDHRLTLSGLPDQLADVVSAHSSYWRDPRVLAEAQRVLA